MIAHAGTKRRLRRTLGIMSGTSLDGVDLSLVEFGKDFAIESCLNGSYKMPKQLREGLLAFAEELTVSKRALMEFDRRLGKLYLDTCRKFLRKYGLSSDQIDLIGLHGQTVFHEVGPGQSSNLTLQIGSADILAQALDIDVVSDFRSADVAAGGRGAPLAPIAHYHLFRSTRRSRLVVNIGGISNVTYLPARCNWEAVRASDSGPGNMIIDQVVQRLFDSEFDRGGRFGAAGNIDDSLFRTLMKCPFLKLRPPIALGREQYGTDLVNRLLDAAEAGSIAKNDVVATISYFTVYCISRVAATYGPVDDVLVCGGGARNRHLMDLMKRSFPTSAVTGTDILGVDPDFVESIAFALLANLSFDGVHLSVSHITGSHGKLVFGKVTRA